MRRLALLCVALLAAGCYDSRFGERGDDATPEPVTATIRQLREKFAGTTFPVTGDIVVSGRVTTSDYDENFYRTFCIEEDGAGIEVMAGIDHLHNDFPEGCHVTLRLRGLALGESHGVLQAGRMPAAGSGFATDYIGSKAALDAAVTRNGEALEPIAPTLLSPGELTPERCGTLVRIGALGYTPEDLTPGTWAGYKRFTDDTGAAVYTYVRSYARFADDEVPVGRCTLTGILQYDATGEGRYILKLRDENDCTRSGSRRYPARHSGQPCPSCWRWLSSPGATRHRGWNSTTTHRRGRPRSLRSNRGARESRPLSRRTSRSKAW